MRVRYRALLCVCAVVFSFFFLAPVIAGEISQAPINPDYLKYVEDLKTGRASTMQTGVFTGYRPGPLDLSHLAGKRIFGKNLSREATFPALFDLRTLDRVTAVRDQQSTGTCWAFAALGSVESNILTQGGGVTSLSPKHLAWFVFKSPVHFTFSQQYFDGDPSQPFPPNRNVFEQGGNNWQAIAALARWIGPVNEADCPYGTFPYSTAELSTSELPTGNETVQRHLQNALYLAGPLGASQVFELPAHAAFVANVKTALQTYGALSILFRYDPKFLNEAHSAFYQPDGQGGEFGQYSNHAVTLVGWDDNYPKENMVVSGDDGAGYTPPANGAWLFKNSWGASAGDNGYYWISYYNRVLKDGIAYVTEATTNYDAVYEHDPLGWVTSYGYTTSATPDTAYFANVFTAGTPTDPLAENFSGRTSSIETLRAISFYAGAINSQYTIWVYRGGSAGDPTNGTLVSGPQVGVLEAPGYHTITLETTPSFSAGERFTVVVRLKTPDFSYPLPAEIALAGYSDAATAGADQSYISSNGTTWTDVVTGEATANACLKAFTTTTTVTPTPTTTIAPTVTPTVTHAPTVTGGGSSGGGGCSAGMFAPFALLLFVPLFLTRK